MVSCDGARVHAAVSVGDALSRAWLSGMVHDDAARADLAQYATPIAMDDLNEVREALS